MSLVLTLERAVGHLQKGAPGTVAEVKPLYYSAAPPIIIIIIIIIIIHTALVTVRMEVSDVQVTELFIH